MTEIIWRTTSYATKHSLEKGIAAWIRAKTGLELVQLPSLYRVNFDEMMLMAMAMGYVPTAIERARVDQDQFYLQREIDRRRRLSARTPSQTPHPFSTVEGGTFCATCGAIKASRLHDPVTSEGGIALSPFPQSQALIAAAIEEIESEAAYEIARDAGASDSGLDADYEEKGGPF
jgi:hypothetical protein